MAKSMTDLAATVQEKGLLNGLTGSTTQAKNYKVTRGSKAINEPRSANILVFGDWGTGKSYIIIQLLKLNLKVVVLCVDFGKAGMNTVYNYFDDHPEEAHLLDNLIEVKFQVEGDTNQEVNKYSGYLGFVDFKRDPSRVIADIYEWDPDVLFLDGLTALQQGDLEQYICKDDPLRQDVDWKDWRSASNGTIFPLMDFLALHNYKTGKQWCKVVTALEDKKGQTREVLGANGRKDRETIPGTEVTGPMLHTGARKVSGAGFDIILEAKVERGKGSDPDQYIYLSRGKDILLKDRGFKLPERIAAEGDGFLKLWREYIAPKIKVGRAEEVAV